MIDLKDEKIKKAFEWLELSDGEGFLADGDYCETRDFFQARSSGFLRELEIRKSNEDKMYSLYAVLGEIGNNSFDHNLGNWRDIQGIYFTYDLEKKFFILADRGQGIYETIKPVKPEIKSNTEALEVAFKEVISGRAPEHRGNGLKFVLNNVKKYDFTLYCYSGDACVHSNEKFLISKTDFDIKGVISVVMFNI